jgi:hypothetical protein
MGVRRGEMSYSSRIRSRILVIAGLIVFGAGMLASVPVAAQSPSQPATPAEMVATYDTLADGILALKLTEENLVRSILAAARAHGEVQLARANKALESHDSAALKTALEALAADVAQMATEGDNSVGAVRKRLLQGGHHHNAAGEAQGIFEEGYVIVTRAAKQKLLEASRRIARLAAQPTASALQAEWKMVDTTYSEIVKPAK